MPTRASANGAGLSTADLEKIRETLAGGRKPKVMFTASAGQIAGQSGQVVQLTDPAESDEWVVVRFGHDELPFPPHDLTVPPRGRAPTRSAPPPAPHLRKEATMPNATTETSTPTATTADAPPDPTPVRQAGNGKPVAAPKAAKPAKAAKLRTPPGLTVTLAYQDGEWTVAAHQGSKVLAKPYLIKPAEALKMVGMIDVPGVHEAVEALVAAERAEAEQRAETLRAQLVELEAHLAELRDAT